MKAILSTVLVAALAAATFQAAAQGQPHVSFEHKKAVALKALDHRDAILKAERSCISAAATGEQMQTCLHRARESREEMGEKLRAEMGKKPR